LQIAPPGTGDKTLIFDSAAGGFVYVDGATHLKEQRPAILARFEKKLNHGFRG
jgi:hypothetical protein